MKKRVLICTIVLTMLGSIITAFAADTRLDTGSDAKVVSIRKNRPVESDFSANYTITKKQQTEIDQAVKDYFTKVKKSTIIGVDERQTVANADKRIAILLIKFPGQEVVQGTGFLIYLNQFFATAGHCLYNKYTGQRPEWITVIPGSTNGSAPIGTYTVAYSAVSPGYINYRGDELKAKNFDYGIIKLDRPTPDMVPFEFDNFNYEYVLRSFQENSLTIQGYPDERIYTRSQAVSRGRLNSYTDRYLFYKIDTSAGQSGSPIICHGKVIGIHTTGVDYRAYDDSSNSGIKMTNEIIQEYRDWIMHNINPSNLFLR